MGGSVRDSWNYPSSYKKKSLNLKGLAVPLGLRISMLLASTISRAVSRARRVASASGRRVVRMIQVMKRLYPQRRKVAVRLEYPGMVSPRARRRIINPRRSVIDHNRLLGHRTSCGISRHTDRIDLFICRDCDLGVAAGEECGHGERCGC